MSSLDERIKSFLPTLRLGVDFGETAGGIALVQGRKILHAETFVDFHKATLETRRTLRRGRRTRHARKMRIAHLRSWLLRQKLPAGKGYKRIEKRWEEGGDRLPDPYWLAGEPRYQTKPGVYRKTEANPLEAPGWIEQAKQGKGDAAGFVCALTLIFKKRGYKYDDEALSDYSDRRLVEFLESCCQLDQDEEFSQKIKAEIEKRESEGHKKTKLQEAYQEALKRPREPRKALPRILIEKELKEVIESFTKSIGLSENIKDQWIKELTGLLNQFVRLARFDNRIKATCSWCGKKTPRTAKVREIQYRAAVRNIRRRGPLGWQKLTPEQEKPLFSWPELWLRHQAGQHKFSLGKKDAVTAHSPNKENIEKYLWSVNAKPSYTKGKDGRSKLSFPMAAQLENLIKGRSEKGRSKLCREHLQMAADGKTMKDAGVEWQTLRVRAAPNPRREQHDERVLRRIEALLFQRGKTGDQAWRYGPLSFITLEVPEPATLRATKGETPEKQESSLRQRLHDETGGICIYTGNPISVEDSEKDHIVPRSKGGPDVRVNMVCASKLANNDKNNRLPSEWMGWETQRFKEFRQRIEALSTLPKEKKELLLLEPGSSYPENETALAHVGARPRQFVSELVALFKRYGVEEAPTLQYETKKPLVQRVGGRWTTELRRSWLFGDKEGKVVNFPEKDRRDLYNHAQDAALLTATPPHTWRDQVLCERAIRPCAKRDEKGQIVRKKNGGVETEMRQRPGVARLDLAPDWKDFLNTWKRPLVRVLGRTKTRWHKQLIKQSLFQDPSDLESPKLKIHKPLDLTEQTEPGQPRRKSERTQRSSGLLLRIPVHSPTKAKSYRKMEANDGIDKEAAIFWRDKKGKFNISIMRPSVLQRLKVNRLNPEIPLGAEILGKWEPRQSLNLPGNADFKAGFYRVKELTDANITVIPENSVTKQMAEALGFDKKEITNPEHRLGKGELEKILTTS